MRTGFPLLTIAREDVDERPLFGYVVARSRKLLVLHYLSDDYRLDGWRIVRTEDVTRSSRHFSTADVAERSLRLKRQRPRVPCALDLSTMPKLIASVQAAFPIIVIHREALTVNEAEVGLVRLSGARSYVLQWITPEAEWEPDHRRFRYADITMVGFGGEYETTLVRVAKDRAREARRKARTQDARRGRASRAPGAPR